MSNDIRSILERLATLEGRITPDTPTPGLNPQQKSVPQLPALFKPKKISVLGAKTDPEHPMKDYAVGASESIEESAMSEVHQLLQDIGTGEADIYDVMAHPKTPVEKHVSGMLEKMYDDVSIDHRLHPDDDFEEILDIIADRIAQDYPAQDNINEDIATEEKLLDKVKKSFIDYIESVEDKIAKKVDKDLGEKPQDHELGSKAKDRDLVTKDLDEDPTTEEPADTDELPTMPAVAPTMAESGPVKSISLSDGRICEIHGNEATGFEIRHGNRSLKSRFKHLDEAEMALEMYRIRCQKNDESADYVDEA